MNQFYIVEIQMYRGVNGEPDSYGHIIHYAYDEDATKARLKAESKFHEILAAAAISELPQHSATLLTSDGRAVMNQCYRHELPTPEPEPEPTPEPEPEGGEEPEEPEGGEEPKVEGE